MPTSLEHPDPVRDPNRLAALRHLSLLDSPPDPAFDRLTRLAAAVLGAPIALVSLVDSERQFFKSPFGLPEPWHSQRQTPLTYSFCQHVVAAGQPLLIENSREHPLTRDNRPAIDIGMIAYLGIPLITADGYTIGTLCVLDTSPRTWSPAEIEILTDIGASVMSEIRLISRAADRHDEAWDTAEAGILGLGRSGRCTFINPAAARMLGYASGEIVGQHLHNLVHHEQSDTNAAPEDACLMCQVSRAHQAVQLNDQVLWRRDGTPVRGETLQ